MHSLKRALSLAAVMLAAALPAMAPRAQPASGPTPINPLLAAYQPIQANGS